MLMLAFSSSTLCNTSLNTSGSGLLLLLNSESLFLQSMQCALHDYTTFESHQRLACAMYMIKGERMVPDFWSALPGTVIAFGLKWVPWPIIRRTVLAEHRGETLGPWWLQEDDYWKPMMGLLHKCQKTTHNSKVDSWEHQLERFWQGNENVPPSKTVWLLLFILYWGFDTRICECVIRSNCWLYSSRFAYFVANWSYSFFVMMMKMIRIITILVATFESGSRVCQLVEVPPPCLPPPSSSPSLSHL